MSCRPHLAVVTSALAWLAWQPCCLYHRCLPAIWARSVPSAASRRGADHRPRPRLHQRRAPKSYAACRKRCCCLAASSKGSHCLWRLVAKKVLQLVCFCGATLLRVPEQFRKRETVCRKKELHAAKREDVPWPLAFRYSLVLVEYKVLTNNA